MRILRLEIHIDTTREDTFRDMAEAIISLLEATLSMVTIQTVVTIPVEDEGLGHDHDEAIYLEDER
jgi:hypothetical protein